MLELMRDIRIESPVQGGGFYRLRTYDTGRTGRDGKYVVAYAFWGPTGLLFRGRDFSPGMGTAIDSDDAVVGLLGFLTLRPGDTDEDYFAGYSAKQLAFAEGEAEELQLLVTEAEYDEDGNSRDERSLAHCWGVVDLDSDGSVVQP